MKRNIVVIAVLVLGICCFSGMTVGAAQNEAQEDGWEESGESQAESEESLTESEESLTENEESSTESGESQAENEESLTEAENGRESEEPQAADGKTEEPELCSLEIPQKLGVVIDPWEVAGKGQIYSEQYIIKNTGDVTGVLTLTFLCRRGEDSAAVIRTDTAGLHDDENKSIYIEMIFGDAEGIALTEEGVEYQAQLQPGEELSVSFAGEVNEYASERWGDSDVEIEGVYFWNPVEDRGTAADADETDGSLASEADEAEGTEGKTAADGDALPGNDSAEETDSSAADEPAEGSEGQDGTEPAEEPAGGAESDSLSGGEDGETAPEEGEELSVPEDEDDSWPMEDAEGEAEPGTEDIPETLSGNVE